jgi:hypothetical protein
MSNQLVFISPSRFVDELLRPGLMTSQGPVALSRYVSSFRRSPLAAAVSQQLRGLINGRVPAPEGHAEAVARLRRLWQEIVSGGGTEADTNWRHVFSGHGQPRHLQAVWNFLQSNRSLLLALPPLHAASDANTRHAAAARDFSWLRWFDSGNPVPAMVRDGVFGYDCLGLLGNYLIRAGLERSFPSREVRGYAAMREMTPLTRLDEVRPLCLLVWPATATGSQHIAIVDRVNELRTGDPNHPRLDVDIVQAAGIGPQVNRRVTLARNAGVSIDGPRGPMQAFLFVERGSPAAPHYANCALMQHNTWQLATA